MHFFILDFEATCWSGHTMNREQEIIEIGICRVNRFGEIVGKFQSFIKPRLHPRLSLYCTDLTGITQSDVDRASYFNSVYDELESWLLEAESESEHITCTWGSGDIPLWNASCKQYRLDPQILPTAIDLKHQFAKMHQLPKAIGLQKAMAKSGLEFEGDHHRALDDAYNTARLFRKFLDEWEY